MNTLKDLLRIFALLNLPSPSRWWIPIKWAIEVLNTAKREKFITNQPGFSHLMGRLSDFRRGLTEVASYGYLPVPLVYTQVVHLAVYVFFAVR